jgi:hypothetical protein
MRARNFIFVSVIILRNPRSGVTADAAGIRGLACCIGEKSAWWRCLLAWYSLSSSGETGISKAYPAFFDEGYVVCCPGLIPT